MGHSWKEIKIEGSFLHVCFLGLRDLSVGEESTYQKIERLKIQDIEGTITKERRFKRRRKKYQHLMVDTVLV